MANLVVLLVVILGLINGGYCQETTQEAPWRIHTLFSVECHNYLFSHSDFHAPELSCSKEFFVLSQKEGPPSDMSGPTSISPCPVTSEITASTRTPFAVKNSLCNSEGDFSTGLSIGAVEKISSLSSLKGAQTENS